MLTGVPGKHALSDTATDLADLLRSIVLNNQVVLGTVNAGPPAFAAAIIDLEACFQRWPVALDALLSKRIPIECALAQLMERRAGIKHVITFA
jgi:hypothetical protein